MNCFGSQPLSYLTLGVGLWGEWLRTLRRDIDAVNVLEHIEQARGRIPDERVYVTPMADIAWWDPR